MYTSLSSVFLAFPDTSACLLEPCLVFGGLFKIFIHPICRIPWMMPQMLQGFNRIRTSQNTRVYPKVSGLATWSENCKWYSSLPLGAVASLFCESV